MATGARAGPDWHDNAEDIGRQIAAVRSTTANADLLFRRLLVADNDELVLAHLRAVAGASRQVPQRCCDRCTAVARRRRASSPPTLSRWCPPS